MTILERRITSLQGHVVPPDAHLVGLSAIAHTFEVQAPIRRLACVSANHVAGSIQDLSPWRLFDKRYDPGDALDDNLVFAMRHDDLDLLVLKRVLAAIPTDQVQMFLAANPTGSAQRRLWCWYEFLLGRRLDLPDVAQVAAIDLLDAERYFVVPGELSARHKVRMNQLGMPGFCPIIRRTLALDSFQAMDLAARAAGTMGRVSNQLIMRAASFMLLKDSKASFEIEEVRPPRGKLERWGRAVLEAGRKPMDLAELVRLHAIMIHDDRFVQIGLRDEGVFLGEHDDHQAPVPEFIGARPDDLTALIEGLFVCNDRLKVGSIDPVLQAVALAFGFIYIHPLEDGNGRIHRCLIHQVLADRGFAPPGIVFPVSSVMADRIEAYRTALRAHSGALMDYIAWRPTPRGNVEVTNDTADLYRYADLTDNAEFLYACVARTIDVDLPRELDYLRRHDQALQAIMDYLPLADRQARLIILWVTQNEGKFPRGRLKQEFAKLTPKEIADLEAIVDAAFTGFIGAPAVGTPPTVEKRWSKKLTATCAQHPPKPVSKHKGSITLGKGRGDEGHDIDPRTYFVETFFDKQPWPAAVRDDRSRIVKVAFDVFVAHMPFGIMHFDVDHKPSREAGQGNVATILHWGPLLPILRATDHTGSYVVLERFSNGTYRLTITKPLPGPSLP